MRHLWEATPVADRSARLAAVLLCALCACGTSRDTPDSGNSDAGIGPRPLAVVLYVFDGGFAPASIAPDFGGDWLCADATQEQLVRLGAGDLGPLSSATVGTGTWSEPLISVGRGGQAFMTTALQDGEQVWKVDLGADTATRLATIPSSSGFHARRDAPGFVFAPQDAGGVWLADENAQVTQLATSSSVSDIATSAGGAIFAAETDGAHCTRIESVGADAGTSLSGTVPPCVLAVSTDGETLWFAGASPPDTQVLRFDAHSLTQTGSWTISGFTVANHSPLIAGNGDVALIGANGAPLALGRAIWLAQDGGFQVVGTALSGYVSDGAFDDANALYLTLPQARTVAVVR